MRSAVLPAGPVLIAGPMADAIVAAIRMRNRDVSVSDRGAYVRVACPGRCMLSRAEIEAALGHEIDLRRELELNMPSFQGKLLMSADEVTWTAPVGAKEAHA